MKNMLVTRSISPNINLPMSRCFCSQSCETYSFHCFLFGVNCRSSMTIHLTIVLETAVSFAIFWRSAPFRSWPFGPLQGLGLRPGSHSCLQLLVPRHVGVDQRPSTPRALGHPNPDPSSPTPLSLHSSTVTPPSRTTTSNVPTEVTLRYPLPTLNTFTPIPSFTSALARFLMHFASNLSFIHATTYVTLKS